MVKVIGHGGANSLESLKDIIYKYRPDGLAAASVFHYKDFSIKDVKNYLSKNKILVRI